jgi:hypothetical protein
MNDYEQQQKLDVEKQGDALHQAIEDKKGNPQLIKIMCSLTNDQRQLLKDYYISAYGETLEEVLKDKLSGNFEDCMVALLDLPEVYDAKLLNKAISGAGTDEDLLSEVIATRPKWRLEEIKEQYEKLYKVTLEEDIKGDTSGIYQKLLVALISGGRSENVYPNETMCKQLCEELYNKEQDDKDKDEDFFIKTFAVRSTAEIAIVAKMYQKKYKSSLFNILEKKFSGDEKNLFITLLKAILNPSKYFAERIHEALTKFSVDNKLLIRVLVTRDEIDMPEIKKWYKKLYNEEMNDTIKNKLKGEYLDLIVELIKE